MSARKLSWKAFRISENSMIGRFSAWLFRIAQRGILAAGRRKPETELVGEPRPRNTGGRLLPVELSWQSRARSSPERDQREAVLLKVYQGFQVRGDGGDLLECPVSTSSRACIPRSIC